MEQLREIVDQAQALPDGPIKVALFEEAVRRADCSGNMDWRFFTRYELFRSAFCAGEPDKMLVTLTWCLAKCDELGGCYEQSRLLWGCLFALSYITCFTHISRTQIEALQEDVSERFRKFGASLRSPHIFGMVNQLEMGFPESATQYYRRWQAAPKDEFSQPPAWERYFESWFLHETNQSDRALEIARPVLEQPDREREVYHWVIDTFLMELLKRRDRERAIEGHRRGYRTCSENPKFIAHVGTHLLFLSLTDNFAQAARLLEKHLATALQSQTTRFSFFLKVWVALRHFDRANHKLLRVRLPKDFPLYRDDGRYQCSDLADWFERETHDIEARFNQRNGTTRYTDIVNRTLAFEQWAVPWPIRA